ncbi:tRNA-dihydrouridine(16/17) synthase [NAD(P)(+)]-like, partial [Cucumispora dikerogammari]
ANWTIIKKIKQLLSIPVIANGNIVTKKDIINLLKYTECDGVMVAESHLYDPLIFYTESCSSNNKYVYYSNQQDCLKLIKNNGIYGLLKVYIDLAKECKEENEIRSHLFKITHKFAEHNFKFFEDLNKCRGIEGYEKLIEKYKGVLVEEECTVKIRGVYTDTSLLMLH